VRRWVRLIRDRDIGNRAEDVFVAARGEGGGAREQSKCMEKAPKSRMDKGAGFGQIVRVASRERILPTRLQIRFRLLNSNL
jgi:hypothetical protein